MYLKNVKRLINRHNIDAYIIPKNDEYFSEYSNPNRLKAVTNFTGSAGLALILKKKNFLFVDGRYTLQALKQSGSNFNILEIPKYNPDKLLRKFKNSLKIGYDPKLFTKNFLEKNFLTQALLFPIIENIFIKNRKDNSENVFYDLDEKVTGEKYQSKIKKLVRYLKINKVSNLFISAPENVAWLLNIRGNDNPHSPIPNSKLILTDNGTIYLIAEKNKFARLKKKIKYTKINFVNYENFYDTLSKIEGNNFQIDEITCSVYEESLIKSKFKVIKSADPCYKLKSIKNSIEINNTKKIHIYDGIALTKFLFWIKYKNKKKITELDAERVLEKFRRKSKKYLNPSFETISASGPNGAIIHYRATKSTNKRINTKDLYLCDSGGQYKYGTTDVTRTISFTKQNKKIIDNFTRVLKGHIAVVNANLSKFKRGNQLDILARSSLKKNKLDYPHGTGHGVGYFLNIHEGPQAVSKNNYIKLQKGMILSNEPGYYKKNRYGIRIENLIYVKKINKKLSFENLTLVPIDKDLINFKMLSYSEKNYLKIYHKEIFSKLKNFLSLEEKNWLINLF